MAGRNFPDTITRLKGKRKISVLTAYSFSMAKLLDPHVDVLLVGDSLAMVEYGLPSTLDVSVPTMIRHGAAVVRGSSHACVVVDLPFGSYQQSPQAAFTNAARVLARTQAQAVKLEGGAVMAETVAFLVARGIPVMGHVGLTPQSVNTMGGFKIQGKTDDAAQRIIADTLALQQAGAFAIVLEAIPHDLARTITQKLAIPTIGIGSGTGTDGQVLVSEDLFGLSHNPPPFVDDDGAIRALMLQRIQAFTAC